jgi:uridine phosphorylase
MQPSRAQVQAYFFGSPRQVGEKILFIKRDQRLMEYAAYLTDVEAFGNVWRGITGRLHGVSVSVIVAGVGPSMVGDAVYALDRPGAACLYSGTCGGLHPALGIGATFVADQAVCGDGYSLHFGRAPFSLVPGDPDALRAVKAALTAAGTLFDSGITFTTSSVVREADTDFWHSIDGRCRIIEMGTAAFYAAAWVSGKRATAYFWVTDLPTRSKSFFDQLSPEDVVSKEERYRRTVALDMALLAGL